MENVKEMELIRKAKKQYYKQWADANKEHIKQYSKEWRTKNKEKVQEYNHNYWLKKAKMMQID